MRTLPTVALSVVAFMPLAAQGAGGGRLVDEGTFVITKSGAPIGREAFRIVRAPSGSGDVYRATAQLSLGAKRMAPLLITDTSGSPISYNVDVREGGFAERLEARTRPGRFSVVRQTPHGESAKEFVVPASSTVLENDVFHQYFFLGLHGGGTATILVPLAGSELTGTLQRHGSETLEVGGRPATTQHCTVAIAGRPSREFWLDSSGRVLRVAIPEQGILAQRDELPR